MSKTVLLKIIEHNNWANGLVFDACHALNNEQLDFQPNSAVRGTIRETLTHIAHSQEDYATMLTRSTHPPERSGQLALSEIRTLLNASGDRLVAFVKACSDEQFQTQNNLDDGYTVDYWVFIVQLINHATEHREQIKNILTALGIEPPRIDGWQFAKEQNALILPSV
ncbi:MAG: DinB family protein [Chloroflexota bacterium]